MLRSDSTKFKNVCLTNLNFKQKKTSKIKNNTCNKYYFSPFLLFLTGAVKSNVHLLLHRLRNILNPRKIWFKKTKQNNQRDTSLCREKGCSAAESLTHQNQHSSLIHVVVVGFVCFKNILWRSHKNMKDRRGVSTVVIIINNNNLNKRKISGIWR